MSALYLGTGKLEKFLLEKLNRQIQNGDDLRVNLIFDYMRGTRFNKDGESTYTMTKDLKVGVYPKPMRVGFYHNPDTGTLKGKGSNGPLREIFGVHHIKVGVFDSTVVLTGANLSEDYFTDRADRYYIIEDVPHIADYFEDLVQVLMDLSYNVNDDGALKMLPHYAEPFKKSKKFKDQMSHHLKYFRFSNRTHIEMKHDLTEDEFFSNEYSYDNQEGVDLLESELRAKSRPKTSPANSQKGGNHKNV